jgi:CRP-like cAMP-binding protein
MMVITVSADMLRRILLFSGLDSDTLEDFSEAGEEISAKQGEMIFDSGEKADFIYVIISGKVELRVALQTTSSRPVRVAMLEQGELLGWSALVKPHAYKLRAIAMEDTQLVKFNGERLRALMVQHPAAGLKIMESVTEVIGSRLASMRFQFVNTIEGQLGG